jgi:uncharacterized membrane protein
VATQDTAVAPKEERTVSFQRSIYDPGYVNAMSHFYRGEMSRIMVWRQRLDVTTNWAITSSTAIITIAFSTREVPHIIFFFNLAIVSVLLWIEARRCVRRFNSALLQGHEARGGRASVETELHLHFHPDTDRVADENISACHCAD